MINRGDFSDPKQKCTDSVPDSLLRTGIAGICRAAGPVSGGSEPKLSGVLYESEQPALHAIHVFCSGRNPVQKGDGGFCACVEIRISDHDLGDVYSLQRTSGGLSFHTCLFFVAEKRIESLHPANPVRFGLGSVL